MKSVPKLALAKGSLWRRWYFVDHSMAASGFVFFVFSTITSECSSLMYVQRLRDKNTVPVSFDKASMYQGVHQHQCGCRTMVSALYQR